MTLGVNRKKEQNTLEAQKGVQFDKETTKDKK